MEKTALKMATQVLKQASVTFHDVAAYFLEEEWDRLGDWQKELYKEVMKEIHAALIALGYTISNPDVLFRIKQDEEPYFGKSVDSDEGGRTTSPGASHNISSPDVLCRIKQTEEPYCRKSLKSEGSGSVLIPLSSQITDHPDVMRNIQENPYLRNPQDSGGSAARLSTSSRCLGFDSALKIKQEVEPFAKNNVNMERNAKSSSISSKPVYHADMSLWIKQVDEPEVSAFEDSADAEGLCDSVGGGGIVVNPDGSLQIKQEEDVISIPVPGAGAGDGAKNPSDKTQSGRMKGSVHRNGKGQSKLQMIAADQDALSPQEQGFSKLDDESPFQCNTCKKCFAHFSNFKEHHRTHTGEKPFKCIMCKKSFSHSSNLTQHMRTHTGERPYTCAECDKTFTMKSHLITHQRLHTGERPHVCADCGKTFTMKSHLITHQRLHTGERPYKCNECSQSYRKASDLVRHKRIHTGEKPYHCSLCEKRFNNLQCLKIHQRSHTGEKPYQCTACEKGFLQNSDLIRHQKTHTGERPFQCSQCEKNFPQRSDLVRHEKIHAAERAYKCAECDKGFNLKSGLTRHQKLHSGMRQLLSDVSTPTCVALLDCKLEAP